MMVARSAMTKIKAAYGGCFGIRAFSWDVFHHLLREKPGSDITRIF
jgi:drug/metabolite transporter superfamily protein YnfA